MAQPKDARDWLAGGGEMSRAIRAIDWSATPLGPIEAWPQSLRTTVSLCLASNFPSSIAWGPKHIQIYNDGYRPICGAKHPRSMGQDFTECWASAWPVIGGGVGGLFHPVTETTARMHRERRVRALRDLAAGAGKAQSVEETGRVEEVSDLERRFGALPCGPYPEPPARAFIVNLPLHAEAPRRVDEKGARA